MPEKVDVVTDWGTVHLSFEAAKEEARTAGAEAMKARIIDALGEYEGEGSIVDAIQIIDALAEIQP